jgi:hypothetical protein
VSEGGATNYLSILATMWTILATASVKLLPTHEASHQELVTNTKRWTMMAGNRQGQSSKEHHSGSAD